MENDWSGSFVSLYGWNNEDVRWDFFYSSPLGSYEFLRLIAKFKIATRLPSTIFMKDHWGECFGENSHSAGRGSCRNKGFRKYLISHMGRLMRKGTQRQNFQFLFFHGFLWRIQWRNQRRKPLEKISRHHKVTALFVTRVYMHIYDTSWLWLWFSPLCGCGRCVPFRMSRPIWRLERS